MVIDQSVTRQQSVNIIPGYTAKVVPLQRENDAYFLFNDEPFIYVKSFKPGRVDNFYQAMGTPDLSDMLRIMGVDRIPNLSLDVDYSRLLIQAGKMEILDIFPDSVVPGNPFTIMKLQTITSGINNRTRFIVRGSGANNILGTVPLDPYITLSTVDGIEYEIAFDPFTDMSDFVLQFVEKLNAAELLAASQMLYCYEDVYDVDGGTIIIDYRHPYPLIITASNLMPTPVYLDIPAYALILEKNK